MAHSKLNISENLMADTIDRQILQFMQRKTK